MAKMFFGEGIEDRGVAMESCVYCSRLLPSDLIRTRFNPTRSTGLPLQACTLP
jgi:hypothetical protein